MEKKTKEVKEYNFGEKETEFYKGENLPVWQNPKYKESKKKATEMINSGKYDLSEADFWILMNTTKNGKMAYTGLIISHNGCLKINDKLENPVNPKCFELDKDGYNNSLVYTYKDEDTYEVGEFSASNGKNAYPYAMALKRCFDRVVLKKSKLAYSGIYSEVESDEFKETIDDTKKETKKEEVLDEKTKLLTEVADLEIQTNTNHEEMLKFYKVESNIDMTIEQLQDAKHRLEMKLKKQKIENLEIPMEA